MKKLTLLLASLIFLSCQLTIMEYYESGSIKSAGKYSSDLYVECCTAGPCEQLYEYKTGNWKYYHENRQLKAVGVYEIGEKLIQTNCEGGDTIKFSYLSNNWKFFNENGVKLDVSTELIREIENHYHSYEKN